MTPSGQWENIRKTAKQTGDVDCNFVVNFANHSILRFTSNANLGLPCFHCIKETLWK